MNKSVISKAIESGNIVWRKHALERMLERDIARDEVIETILNGIELRINLMISLMQERYILKLLTADPCIR